MNSIFSIESAFVALDEMLEASQGELTPEIEAYMKEIGAATVDKVFSVVSLLDYLNGNAKLAKEHAEMYADKAKKLTERSKYYKSIIIRAMVASGKKTITDGIRKVTLTTNPLRVEVKDETAIPKSYLNAEITLSYADYLKIKDQIEVADVKLVAKKKEIGELYKTAKLELTGVSYHQDDNVRIS